MYIVHIYHCIFSCLNYVHKNYILMGASQQEKQIFVYCLRNIQKRFYTRGTIWGIRISPTAEIPILFHDWLI